MGFEVRFFNMKYMVLEMLNVAICLEIKVVKNKAHKKVLFNQNCSFCFVIIASPCKSRWSFSAEHVFFEEFLL